MSFITQNLPSQRPYTNTKTSLENAVMHVKARQIMIDRMSENWQKKLQKVLNDGGFLKFEASMLAGGLVDSKLILVSPDGEQLEINAVESCE